MSQMYVAFCAVMFISGTTATDLETTFGAQAITTGDIVNMITFLQLPGVLYIYLFILSIMWKNKYTEVNG